MYITQSLHQMLQQDPHRPLTVYGDRIRTVAESASRVSRLAGGLRALGVASGDRVAILSLNSDRYHEYLLAVPWADAVITPVNTRWSVVEIATALRESRARVLLVDDTFNSIAEELQEQCPELTTVVHCGDEACPPGMADYEQLIADSEPVEDARRGGDALFGLFYTGGTSGSPKGVMISHNNIMISALGSLATCGFISPWGRLLHVAPMFHLADIGVWSMAMLASSAHVILPAFVPRDTLKAIAEHQVTDALLVPTMMQMIVDLPEASSYDLSSVTNVLYGTSPISEKLLQRIRGTFSGAAFMSAYGMTELSPIATILTDADHETPELRRSAGRSAAHSEVRIVDADDNELPRGSVGEVVVRGDHMMLGYWQREEETAQALRGGWMHTGDGGYMDENGYVFIVDRIKDMIVSGGENVYSIEVENALAHHPAVSACAVIGIPDEQWGEKVHAVVVLHPDHQPGAAELQDFCRKTIAGYKVPRSFAFVDSLPLSGAGKILKRELRKQYWPQEGRQVN
ncbi:MAG: long-chain-fatty-acid--CoA ligase [Nocardiopsaceae bacterium]|nr:long-chain-fatty-acid--CoA ligase [Nocardiopsaceae bacterium]